MEFFQELSKLLPQESFRDACSGQPAHLPTAAGLWEEIRKHARPQCMEVTCVVDFPFRDLRTAKNPNGLDLPWELALLERAWVFDVDGFSNGSPCESSGLRMVVHGHTLMRWNDRPRNLEARMDELTSINVRVARQNDRNLFEEVFEPLQVVPCNPWLKANWRQCVGASQDEKASCMWQLRGEQQIPRNEHRSTDVRAVYTFIRKLVVHAEKALRLQGPDVLEQFYCETYTKAQTMRFLRGAAAFADFVEPEVLLLSRARTGVEIVSNISVPAPSHGVGLRVRALCIGVGGYGNRRKKGGNTQSQEGDGESAGGEVECEDSEYFQPLKNAISDASALNQRINDLGPSIGRSDLIKNPEKRMHLRKAVRSFAESISTSPPPELALLYFAGHGIQESTDIFLIPSNASPTENDDLKDECFSLDEVLATLVGTCRVRNTLEDQRFLVIIDACRKSLKEDTSLSSFQSPELCGPKQNDAPKKLSLLLSSSRGGAAFDSFPGTGSHSPLAHELLSPAHGVFAPDMMLNDALECICESLERRTESRQRSHIVNPHKLKGIVLNPVLDPEMVSPSVTLDLLGILRQHDLGKPEVLKVLTDDLGLEKPDDLECLTPEYLQRECSSQLEKLKPVPRKRFIDLVHRLTAQNVADHASSASTISTDNSDDEGGCRVSCSKQAVVALYNAGNVTDFREKITSFLENLRTWFSDQQKPFACLMILMEIIKRMTFKDSALEVLAEFWFERCKLMSLDVSLVDNNPVQRQAWVQRFPGLREDARIVDGFEELYRAGEPPLGVGGLGDGDKEHSLTVRAIDTMVRKGLIPNFEQQEINPEEWRCKVLDNWHSNEETLGSFLLRADRFLFGLDSDDMSGLGKRFELWTLTGAVETQSFVAFCTMGRFQEMVLFTYLDLSGGPSEGNRHNLQGFKSVASSTRNSWSSESRQLRTRRQPFSATFDLLKHLQRLRPRNNEVMQASKRNQGNDANDRASQVGQKRRRLRSASTTSSDSESGGEGGSEEGMAVDEGGDGEQDERAAAAAAVAAAALAEAKQVQAVKEEQLLRDKWSAAFVAGALLQQRCAGSKGVARCRKHGAGSAESGPSELGEPMIPEVARSHKLDKLEAYRQARASQAYAPNRGGVQVNYLERAPTAASGAPRPGAFTQTVVKRYAPGVLEPVLIPLTGRGDVYEECEMICEVWVEFSYTRETCDKCTA